jgi:16S rRNA (uracil1498-N3)-methyltransferase
MSPRAPHRFYYPGHLTGLGENAMVEMTPEESHHLLRVLRLKPGSQVDIFDAGGLAWTAEMAGERGGAAVVRLLWPLELAPPEHPIVNLAVAIIKRNPMDWMIEKLSELGVESVQPLLAARSVGQGDIKPYSEPPERWDRLAIAAAKQCGRNRPLILLPPAPVGEWLQRPHPPARCFYAHGGSGALRLGPALAGTAEAALPIWIAIGPEGGWTPEEREAFQAAGYSPVLLGNLTLRSETAAIAAAAVCRLV